MTPGPVRHQTSDHPSPGKQRVCATMKLAITRTAGIAATVVLIAGLSACGRGDDKSSGGGGTAKSAIGIDLPRSDSDFWNSYVKYIEQGVSADKLKTLPTSNSQNDVTKLVANVQV